MGGWYWRLDQILDVSTQIEDTIMRSIAHISVLVILCQSWVLADSYDASQLVSLTAHLSLGAPHLSNIRVNAAGLFGDRRAGQ